MVPKHLAPKCHVSTGAGYWLFVFYCYLAVISRDRSNYVTSETFHWSFVLSNEALLFHDLSFKTLCHSHCITGPSVTHSEMSINIGEMFKFACHQTETYVHFFSETLSSEGRPLKSHLFIKKPTFILN